MSCIHRSAKPLSTLLPRPELMDVARRSASALTAGLLGAFALLLLVAPASRAGDAGEKLPLLPWPAKVEVSGGTFRAGPALGVSAARGAGRQAELLASDLRASTGWKVPVTASGGIRLSLEPALKSGYRLLVTPRGVEIAGSDEGSLFHGCQTFLQLCPPEVYGRKPAESLRGGWETPCLKIADSPRYAWRGILVDVAREFQTKDEMLRLIDSMSMVKLNVLHWHLTDDQGWRPEIRGYPKLTAGTDRRYTRQDLVEIVSYASARGIAIVPEIDVPGHSGAVARAYPELCLANEDGKGRRNMYDVSNPEVYAFLETVIGELASIFPGEYIHLGGDEAQHWHWEKDPGCRKLMEEHGLKNSGQLQSWFLQQVGDIVRRHGRKAIAWDEALAKSADKDLAIMSWRGVRPGMQAAKANHKVVMCPVSALYYDRAQSRSSAHPDGYSGNTVVMSQSYFFEPAIPTLDDAAKANILGAQGCVWGEKIRGGDHLQRMVMPRGAALAESLWSPRQALDWDSFLARLEVHRARMDARGIPYWWEPESTEAMVGNWRSIPSSGVGEIDVSKFVTKEGLHEFLFHYAQGEGSFNLLKAELLENGVVVAEDAHASTGTVEPRSPNQYYLLNLKHYDPAAKYALRYRIEAVKGGCGGVVMLVPPLRADRYSDQRGPDANGNRSGQKQPDET